MTFSPVLALCKRMNYRETIDYIHKTPKFSRELGNRLLLKLLQELNNPQKQLRVIHVAGTNGKGSTSSMIAEILQYAGFRCGLFTSPFIERFNERMRINGREIPNEDLARIVSMIRGIIEEKETPVSEFALDTAAAFWWFWEQKCDYVILETGMGGRLDATNVIEEPLVTVLTSIGMDHMQYLGNTIEEITREKCGIIKENCPVVSYPQQDEKGKEIIQNVSLEHHAPLFVAAIPTPTPQGMVYKNKEYKLGLKGSFQAYNGATALCTIEVLKNLGVSVPDEAVEKGLLYAKNMARYERFGNRVILDGGHNLPAAKALCRALREEKRPIHFLIGMMEDKDCNSFLDEIIPMATSITVTELSIPRCMKAKDLAVLIREKGNIPLVLENPTDALAGTLQRTDNNDLICICGSLYLAGKLRPHLTDYFHKAKK